MANSQEELNKRSEESHWVEDDLSDDNSIEHDTIKKSPEVEETEQEHTQ